MATTTAFGSLSVPAPDEMEMSSPANRNLDDDIDIDFEDYQEGAQVGEDERMIEDGDRTRPNTALDEMMDDIDEDIIATKRAIEEEVGYDLSQTRVVQEPQDEELIDYGDDELHDQVVDDSLPSLRKGSSGEIGFVQLGEEASAVFEGSPADIPAVTLQEDFSSEAAQPEEPAEETAAVADAEDFLASEAHDGDGPDVEDDQHPADQVEVHEVADEAAANPQTYQAEEEEDGARFPPLLDTAVSTSTDTPGTPTDTGLHPMNVRYGDMLLPLFKSKRQPEGLLKGDNLASLSLADVIKSCRERLALKIGEDISEDQELVLSFDRMGLMLVEDCRASFQSSLHDVLQVYLQLHENDGADDIPPLSISLTLQLKFQSSFAILKQAAAGGQGMSSFNFLHSTTGEHDYYQDEYLDTGDLLPHDGHATEDGFEGQDYGNTADTHYDEGAQTELDGHFQDQYGTTGEQGEEGYDEYYQDQQYTEHVEEEFYLQEGDEAAVRLDEIADGHRYSHGLLATAFEDPGVVADEVAVARQQADSTASSATAQGDPANNSTGEYDDELIDWDDDSLTSYSEQDAAAQEDFSTFLTEYEEEPAKDKASGDGATNFHEQADADGSLIAGQQADHLGSEDLLDDPAGQEYGEEAHDGEQAAEEGHGIGEHEEEYNFNQADTYDEQHEEYHPDYQPGEEDEQYHTAQDFLNLDQYEHGPEQDVYNEEGDDLDDTVGTVIHHETADYQEDDGQGEFEDEIGFEEDEGTLQNGGSVVISGSPTGKRSFDELDDLDDEDDREVKKARAS